MTEATIGLYLHIPFCRSKCPYCDFYSNCGTPEQLQAYCIALQSRIQESSAALRCKADTLYIGGGTPSVLGADRLESLINQAKQDFLTETAEVTVECNPYQLPPDFFRRLAAVGVNRVSFGLQSAVDAERRILGRLSDRKTVEAAVKAAQSAGICNISLDVMLGIPEQTEKSLSQTLDFCLSLGVPHISAYMLTIEQGTVFWNRREQYAFPDADRTADFYLQLCETLETQGRRQYEISNFAKSGAESRHNLKYWHCAEYLGLGPAAHSFLHGKRFYFPRDTQAFLNGNEPLPDGDGGDFTEYAMLALRLTEGLCESKVQARFGHKIPQEMREKAQIFVQNGYVTADESRIALTRNGFLLSNAILAALL